MQICRGFTPAPVALVGRSPQSRGNGVVIHAKYLIYIVLQVLSKPAFRVQAACSFPHALGSCLALLLFQLRPRETLKHRR
jgi:hypothetical protein